MGARSKFRFLSGLENSDYPLSLERAAGPKIPYSIGIERCLRGLIPLSVKSLAEYWN